MIEQSQQVLLEAIKASLFDITFSYPKNTNWEAVVKEAKFQAIIRLIKQVIPACDQSNDQELAHYVRLLHEQDQLLKLLDENNIPCVILKGCAAAVYYSKPSLRSMGDVDFLVPRNQFEDAMKLLESNGYAYQSGKGDDGMPLPGVRHIGYYKNGIEFELHHHFSSKGFNIDDILEKGIEKREYKSLNGFRFPVLPETENGLVLLGHIHQHINMDKLGLRQIIDWEMYYHAVMNKEKWEKEFVPVAKEIGLYKLAVNVTVMCGKYLGLPDTHYLDQYADSGLSEELLEELLANGNFGIRQQLSSSDSGESVRSVFVSVKRKGLFAYFQDNGLAAWKYSKKHPLLKPFAFIYGMFWLAGKSVKYMFKTRNVKEKIKYANHKNEFYRKLGINLDESK